MNCYLQVQLAISCFVAENPAQAQVMMNMQPRIWNHASCRGFPAAVQLFCFCRFAPASGIGTYTLPLAATVSKNRPSPLAFGFAFTADHLIIIYSNCICSIIVSIVSPSSSLTFAQPRPLITSFRARIIVGLYEVFAWIVRVITEGNHCQHHRSISRPIVCGASILRFLKGRRTPRSVNVFQGPIYYSWNSFRSGSIHFVCAARSTKPGRR